MITLSEEALSAWNRYQAGEPYLYIRYAVIYEYALDKYEGRWVTNLSLKERGSSVFSTSFSSHLCWFDCPVELGSLIWQNRGDFFIQAYIRDDSANKDYKLRRTSWFTIAEQNRVPLQENLWHIKAESRAVRRDALIRAGKTFDPVLVGEVDSITPYYRRFQNFWAERPYPVTYQTVGEGGLLYPKIPLMYGDEKRTLIDCEAEREDYSLNLLWEAVRNLKGEYLYLPGVPMDVEISGEAFSNDWNVDMILSTKECAPLSSSSEAQMDFTMNDYIELPVSDYKPFSYALTFLTRNTADFATPYDEEVTMTAIIPFSPALDFSDADTAYEVKDFVLPFSSSWGHSKEQVKYGIVSVSTSDDYTPVTTTSRLLASKTLRDYKVSSGCSLKTALSWIDTELTSLKERYKTRYDTVWIALPPFAEDPEFTDETDSAYSSIDGYWSTSVKLWGTNNMKASTFSLGNLSDGNMRKIVVSSTNVSASKFCTAMQVVARPFIEQTEEVRIGSEGLSTYSVDAHCGIEAFVLNTKNLESSSPGALMWYRKQLRHYTTRLTLPLDPRLELYDVISVESGSSINKRSVLCQIVQKEENASDSTMVLTVESRQEIRCPDYE